MPPTAEIITDHRWAPAPRLRRTREGWSGERNYRVDTHDEAEALRTVPALGTPWSSNLPTLVVVEQTSEYKAGKDRAASGSEPPTGGLSIVRCLYSEIGVGGYLPLPSTSIAFSELSLSEESMTIHYEKGLVGPIPPIANGDGAPVLVGNVRCRIHTFHNIGAVLPIATWVRFATAHAVNSHTLKIPPFIGTSVSFQMEPGQVRYDGFETGLSGGLLEVIHTVTLAYNFLFKWHPEDAEGKSTGIEIASVVYDSMDLRGHWPGS